MASKEQGSSSREPDQPGSSPKPETTNPVSMASGSSLKESDQQIPVPAQEDRQETTNPTSVLAEEPGSSSMEPDQEDPVPAEMNPQEATNPISMASKEPGSSSKETDSNSSPAQVDQQDPVPLRSQSPAILLVDRPDGKGRSYIAARRIEPGEVLLIDSPLIMYPTALSCIPEFCSYCFRMLPPNLTLHICKTCKMARFCSPGCLARSHPTFLCQALPSLFAQDRCPPELLYLLTAFSCSPEVLLQLLSLQSNSNSPDEKFVVSINSQIGSLFPVGLPHFSRQITAHLISVDRSNSYPFFEPKDPRFEAGSVGGTRAFGIYFWASFFNHSCMPNACAFRYIDEPGRENNTSLIFRAMHEIVMGDEIFITYLALNTIYKERQMVLREDYGFICDCNRCVIESQWNVDRSAKEDEEKKVRRGGKLVIREEVVPKEKEKVPETPQEMVDRKGKGKVQDMPEDKVEARKGKRKAAPEMSKEVNKGTGALGMLTDVAKFDPHREYFYSHMCECGGCLAPFPPSDDRAKIYSKECNKCGKTTQY